MISEWRIGKDVEGRGRGLITPAFAWRDWEKPRKSSVGMANLRAETLTREIPNAKQHC
jgi:hypothetical protein